MTMHADIAAAYRAETARLVRQRLVIVATLFPFLMGTGVLFEVFANPARSSAVVNVWVIESATFALAALFAYAKPFARRPALLAGVATGVVAAGVAHYHATVAYDPERCAMTLTALLNGIAVLLPWGAAGQAFASILSLGSIALVTPVFTAPASAWMLGWIATGVAGVTSGFGAYLLDRYRFEAFRRSMLHAEEAEIAATLLKVTETLSARLGSDDLLEQVNRLTKDATGCDWSSTFLFDEPRGVYRLASNVGSTPAVREMLQQIEFAPDSMPLLRSFRAGTLIEIASPEGQSLAPPAILRRAENASALYAPIGRGDQIVGVLLAGYRTREGAFTEKQRRLTLGIAHALAVALENARLIETLQSASRLKSDFVATMSHELRTPLNVIMGYSEMLAEDVYTPGTDAWRSMLSRIQRASVELMDLISATLDMGRLEAGRDTVMLAPVSLDRMLEEVAHEVEPLVPAGIRFVCANAFGDDLVSTDGAKIKTIVKNLVGNALKFTTHGTVEVNARADGDFLVVAVRDTGIGIAPEHLPVIFDMFRQVDGSTTRRYGGVGLGLHIVKRLVTLLGGTVDVDSTMGVGSTFVVSVPVARATPQRATGT